MSQSSEPFLEPPRPALRPTLRDRAEGFRHLVEGGPRLLGVAGALVAMVAVVLVLWPRSAAPTPDVVLPRASTTLALADAPGAPGVAGATPTTALDALVVDVVGHVRAPGVYRLSPGARITDAIDAAGGLADGADRSRLNLAAPVVDGERVFIPAVGQPVPPVAVGGQPAATPLTGTDGGGDSGSTTPININTASLAELETLPGVGPATAQAIIDHRTANGPFASVEGLLDVRGIGDAKLADLRDRVSV